MRFTIDIYQGAGTVELDLTQDKKTGIYRITSPDIPELDIVSKDPTTTQAGCELLDTVLFWVAARPANRARVMKHPVEAIEVPRDV